MLDIVYSKWRATIPTINNHLKSSTHEISLLNVPSIDDEIIKALKGFSIVESVIKIRNTLVINTDNEQWAKLDEVQKKIFTKTVHGFVHANVKVEAIYIMNRKGEKLALLQKGEAGSNYMVIADKVTKKLETEEDQEAPFDLEKALSTEDTHVQNIAAVSADSVGNSASDMTHKQDIPDITFRELAIEPAPQPVAHQKSKYGVLYKILIVFAVVIMANAAGYYFSFKRQEQAKRSFDLFKKAGPAASRTDLCARQSAGGAPAHLSARDPCQGLCPGRGSTRWETAAGDRQPAGAGRRWDPVVEPWGLLRKQWVRILGQQRQEHVDHGKPKGRVGTVEDGRRDASQRLR